MSSRTARSRMSLRLFYRRSLDVLPQSAHQGLYRRSPQDLAQTERRHDPLDTVARRATESDIVDVILKTCATKVFLANPDMDRDFIRTVPSERHRNRSNCFACPEAPIPHQEPRNCQDRESRSRSQELLALHQRSLDNRKRAEPSRSTDLRKA